MNNSILGSVFGKFWKKANTIATIGLFFLLGGNLLARGVVKEHFAMERWYDFEPGEEFTISGNQYLVTNYTKLAYYKGSSDMVKAEENKEENENSSDTSDSSDISITAAPDKVWSERHNGSENALGLRASWDRLGSHFIDIIPPKKNRIREIDISSVDEMSMWVWSGNYNHELDIVFVRKSGDQQVITLTKLNFLGWRKVRVKIPNRLKMKKYNNKFLSEETYHFDRFRIYTSADDRISNVYVFFDNFEALRSLDDSAYYDGKYLEPVIRQELEDEAKARKNESNDDSNNGNG